MKKLVPVIVIIIVLSSFKFMQQKERVIFFGDSITLAAVQPKGFITLVGDMLKQSGKTDQYELIGAGISGDKVYDLYLRLEDDVLSKNPNTVIIYIVLMMYGIRPVQEREPTPINLSVFIRPSLIN